MNMPIISIPEAIERYARGEFLIVVDDLDRAPRSRRDVHRQHRVLVRRDNACETHLANAGTRRGRDSKGEHEHHERDKAPHRGGA